MPILLMTGFCLSRTASPKVDVYFSPQGGCERRTMELLSRARKQIDIAMYRLNNLKLLGELEKAKARGVKIRILVDRVRALQNKQLLLGLRQKHFDLRVHTRNREQHNSFVVLDGEQVITGSFDWYAMAELFNDENCLVIGGEEGEAAVGKYQRYFDERLWKENTSERSESAFAFSKLKSPGAKRFPSSKK